MPSKRKFYRTLITLEVLSQEPLPSMSLADLAYATTEGDCSGQFKQTTERELDGPQAAAALIAQGSDPGFFGLTEDGQDDEDHQEEGDASTEVPTSASAPSESVIPLPNGREIRMPAYPAPCTYVRVTEAGAEKGYWDEAEWSVDPAGVMGAIMGAAHGPTAEPRTEASNQA